VRLGHIPGGTLGLADDLSGLPDCYVCHRTLCCPKTVLLEAHEALSGKPFLNHSASSQNGILGKGDSLGKLRPESV